MAQGCRALLAADLMITIMNTMKVDRQTHAAHGSAILDAASRLFRARGIDAVRIADVSKAAGLTHGAFYGHFTSKAALAEAACISGLAQSADRWRARAARARDEGRDPIGDIIDAYLTERHRDAPEDGCVLAALGPEIGRADPALRAALACGAGLLVEVLAEELALRHPGCAQPRIEAAADAVMSAMLGGLALSRSYATDPVRSRTALAAAAQLARAAADLPAADLPGKD